MVSGAELSAQSQAPEPGGIGSGPDVRARALLLAIVGTVAAGAGKLWDAHWHSTHRVEGAEWGLPLLKAHGLMYGGMVLTLVGFAIAAAKTRRRTGVTWKLVFAGLVASAVQIIGVAWDLVYHARGSESSTAHLVAFAPEPLAVITAVGGWWAARRAGDPELYASV